MAQPEFKSVISEAFKLTAAGRTARRPFWLAQLVYLVIYLVVFPVTSVLGLVGAAISMAVSIYLMIVSWMLLIRRLHDISKSGWWSLVIFVPLVGLIALVYFGAVESTPGANRWGENP